LGLSYFKQYKINRAEKSAPLHFYKIKLNDYPHIET